MNAINKLRIDAPDNYMKSDCFIIAVLSDGKRHEFQRSGITAPFYPSRPCYMSNTFPGVYVLDGGNLFPSREWHAEAEITIEDI